jgi:hypothetical protein
VRSGVTGDEDVPEERPVVALRIVPERREAGGDGRRPEEGGAGAVPAGGPDHGECGDLSHLQASNIYGALCESSVRIHSNGAAKMLAI